MDLMTNQALICHAQNLMGVFFKNLDTRNIKIAQSEDIVFVDRIGEKVAKAMKKLDLIEDSETRKIMGRRMKKYLGYPNMIFDKKYLCKYDGGVEFWDTYFKLVESES
jgi:chaperonin GroEL (HSP60 family)